MRCNQELRITQDIKTNVSFLQHGELSVLISPKPLKAINTHLRFTEESQKFKWTEEAEKAFNEIKKLLINPPVLKVPIPDGLF